MSRREEAMKVGCFDVAEWILHHLPMLQEKIASLYKPANHLFPPAMHEIYLQQYEDGVVSIVRREVGQHLNINGEQLVSCVTRNSLRRIAPQLLDQPKESS